MRRSVSRSVFFLFLQLGPGVFFSGCTDQQQDTAAKVAGKTLPSASQEAVAPTAKDVRSMISGMYFEPRLKGYTLHNEYDDDGDGDGVKETHIRRYINQAGDTIFSMTTRDRLWAWSLNTKGGDDSEIRQNYVIRDSNCDGVFDERYGLASEFHVPSCLQQGI